MSCVKMNQGRKSGTKPAARRVAVVTGARAEYGIWRPVIAALTGAGLQPQVIATGMHLLPEFGSTWRDIVRDKVPIAARAVMYKKGESSAESLARGTKSLAEAFNKLQPNLVLLLGDRLEMLAAAGAALAQNRWIGHVHGGELAPGQFDQQIRHALTKISHVHFAATAAAARRIRQMGEPRASVIMCGAPALDRAVAACEKLDQIGSGGGGLPLALLHPQSANTADEAQRANMMLGALAAAGITAVRAIGPNNDPGHLGILKAYRGAQAPRVSLEMSADQETFWRYLWESPFLIGNSSSGIIEAATFGRTAINLGVRQAGREQSENVINAEFDDKQIGLAIHAALHDGAHARRVEQRRNVYGQGHASDKIAAAIAALDLSGPPGSKLFVDAP